MKYLKFIGIAALALASVACDDIEDSNSLPQTNPQLPGVDAKNVQVSAGQGVSGVVNLIAVNEADGQINVATVNTPEDWPEGFTPSVPFFQFSDTESFEKVAEVKSHMGAEGEVMVNPDDWDEAFKTVFGKTREEQTGYVRFPVYAVNGTQSVRMGSATTWYNTMKVNVIPFDIIGHVIEENYYIVGSFCNWDVTQAIKMNHSKDYNQYDDPNFEGTMVVDGAGFEWVIIPESTVASGNVNTFALGGEYAGIVIDPKAANNILVATEGTAPNYMVINDAAPYVVALNMQDLTFSMKSAYQYLYTPGDANGWDQGASQTLSTTNYTWYSGFAHISGKFKFTNALDWNGTNYGAGENPGELSTSGGDITVDADALYWATVDLADPEKLTYSLTEITTLGIIGDGTPTGWDGQTNLTPSADFLTWSGEVELKDGMFKFRMNDNWDINLGGDMEDLTVGGADIPTPGAGKYIVTLNLATRPYTCTLVKQ